MTFLPLFVATLLMLLATWYVAQLGKPRLARALMSVDYLVGFTGGLLLWMGHTWHGGEAVSWANFFGFILIITVVATIVIGFGNLGFWVLAHAVARNSFKRTMKIAVYGLTGVIAVSPILYSLAMMMTSGSNVLFTPGSGVSNFLLLVTLTAWLGLFGPLIMERSRLILSMASAPEERVVSAESEEELVSATLPSVSSSSLIHEDSAASPEVFTSLAGSSSPRSGATEDPSVEVSGVLPPVEGSAPGGGSASSAL